MERDDREHREPSGKLRRLFGILSARELRDLKVYDRECIACLAGGQGNMGKEISKGRNLAPYVSVKPGYRQ